LRILTASEWSEIALFGLLVLALLLTRYSLFPFHTPDFNSYFSPWMMILETEGFSAFGSDFANYNVPVLYLLWLGTHLPLEHLTVIKLISLAFELVTALFIALIVRQMVGGWRRPALGFVLVLLLPTVLLNGSMWGQVDSTYAAFAAGAVYCALRDRHVFAWVLIGASVACKLQGAFVLPWLAVILIARRGPLWAPLAGLAPLLVSYIPALAAGRPFTSLLSIYVEQSGTYPVLSASAANLYALFPVEAASDLRAAAFGFAVGSVGILLLVMIRRTRLGTLSGPDWIWWLIAVVLVAPFVLPQMHERYYFLAEVFAVALVCVAPRSAWVVLSLQFTGLATYVQYLYRNEPIDLLTLGTVQFVIVSAVVTVSVLAPHWAREISLPARISAKSP
jgi:Gpi18-like mannosyltransferase